MSKELILPTIKKGGALAAVKGGTHKIATLDLSKKAGVIKALKDDASSIQEQMQQKYHGLDLMLVGDLTGSMSQYYTLLKSKFHEISEKLFPLIQNLRIGIIFYLDHGCGDPYVTKICQPTNSLQEIKTFIDSTCTGCGGDEDEAVEDALNDLLQNVEWHDAHNRSVVLFGDAKCHRPEQCPDHYDFFEITKGLFNKQTTINTVFCGSGSIQNMSLVEIGDFSKPFHLRSNAEFFAWLANVTGGMAITVENVGDLLDIILTAAAKDGGKLEEFAKTVSREPQKLKLIEMAKKAETRLLTARKNMMLGYSK